MRGKVIYSKVLGDCFVQIDKNNQVCDVRSFDKTKPFAERIGERMHSSLLNTFRGRPLRTSFTAIVESIKSMETAKKEE